MIDGPFHEIRFPPLIAYGTVGGPEYSTSIQKIPSTGKERRVGRRVNGIRKWEIKKENLKLVDAKSLEAFFRARKGMLFGFRLRDEYWNRVIDEPLPLLTNTTAQLQFLYPDDINPEIQIVEKPVLAANIVSSPQNILYAPDISLKRGATLGAAVAYPSNAGANWTLNRNTGVITFAASQAGQNFWWSGAFDYPVRFDTDAAKLERAQFDINNWSQIQMLELK